MKKILTIMLSMLMVFSSCLMISAESVTIIYNVTNGSYNITDKENGDVEVQIKPNEGYTYPTSVSFDENVQYSYNNNTGVITIYTSSYTSFIDVVLSAVCPEKIGLKVNQNENGDLIISGNTDTGKEILRKVYDGCGDRVSTQATISVKANDLYYGTIENYHATGWDGSLIDDVAIEKDGDNYKVSKEKLLENGFVNGKWTLRFNVGNEEKYSVDINATGLKDVTPNMTSSLTLEGKVASPIEGESTEIDESSLKLLDQNNKEISKDSYYICWAEKGVNGYGEESYSKTQDETFDISKTYYLLVQYSYIYGENDSKTNIDFTYKYGKLIKQDNFKGATGGTYMTTKSYRTFVMECTVGKAQVKTSSTNDLSKDLVEKVAIKNSASQVQSLVVFDTDEERALDVGKNVEIQMQVNSQSSVTKEDVTKVETKAASDGLTKGAIYDINLYTNIEGETNQRKVTETTAQTVISFPLEERLVNTNSSVNREYKVVRVHDGETTVLDAAYDSTTKSITFKTDKFSTYAICYKDSKKEEKKEESNTSSDTSSTKVVTCEEAMNSKNWTWSESKKACVYKVSNTSSE